MKKIILCFTVAASFVTSTTPINLPTSTKACIALAMVINALPNNTVQDSEAFLIFSAFNILLPQDRYYGDNSFGATFLFNAFFYKVAGAATRIVKRSMCRILDIHQQNKNSEQNAPSNQSA